MNKIEPHFKQLKSLFFAKNTTSNEDVFPKEIDGSKVFTKLETLGLEMNFFGEKWSNSIDGLGNLQNLQTLLLQRNQIVELDPDFGKGKKWSKLQTLNLNANKINDWVSIHNLNNFPSLIELRLRENPILSIQNGESSSSSSNNDQDTQNMHGLLIARIGQIKTLHGTLISERDRLDAELLYLKKSHLELANHTNTAFSQLHPRYNELIEKHGEPQISEMELQGGTINDNLIELLILDKLNNKRLRKKLPSKTLTCFLYRLKDATTS